MDVLATAIASVAAEAARESRESLEAAAAYAAALEAQINRLSAANSDLRKRVVALERRPDLRYRGIWHADEQYAECELVTFDGSLWIARQSTTTRPPGPDWQQCTRKGRDGRDYDGIRRSDRGDDQ